MMKSLLWFVVLSALVSLASGAEHLQAGEVAEREVMIRSPEGHRLYVLEKYLEARDARTVAGSTKVVVLVHTISASGRAVYDLRVPGRSGYSMMDFLAEQGFDVFALDVRGYGRSDKPPCGTCINAAAAAKDIDAVISHIRTARGVAKVNLLGWLWGTQAAGLFTMAHPEKVNRLVLVIPTYKGPWIKKGRNITESPEYSPPQSAKEVEEDLKSRFTGEVALIPPDVLQAYARAKADSSYPTGGWSDLNPTNLPVLAPHKLAVPTAIILGELDQRARGSDLLELFAALPTGDKQYVVIPRAGHFLLLEQPRRLFDEVAKFFSFD